MIESLTFSAGHENSLPTYLRKIVKPAAKTKMMSVLIIKRLNCSKKDGQGDFWKGKVPT